MKQKAEVKHTTVSRQATQRGSDHFLRRLISGLILLHLRRLEAGLIMLYSGCLNVGLIMPESEAERVAADEDESMGWEEERVE